MRIPKVWRIAGVLLFCMVLFVSSASLAATSDGKLVVGISVGGNVRDHVNNLVNIFKAKYPGVEVEVLTGVLDDLSTWVVGGMAPDIAVVNFNSDPLFAGFAQPIDKYINSSMAVAQLRKRGGLQALMFDVALDDGAIGGNKIVMPTLRYYPILGLITDVSKYEESGLPPVDPTRSMTWVQMAADHKKLTRVGPAVGVGQSETYGLDLRQLFYWTPNRIATTFGVDLVNKETGKPALVNLTQPVEWLHDNIFRPIGITNLYDLGTYANRHKDFTNYRKAASLENAPTIRTLRDGGFKNELRATYMPTPNGERIHYMGGQGFIVPSTARNLENAYRFLDLTITELDWHLSYFRLTGTAGAHTLGEVMANRQKWLGNAEQAFDWYFSSLSQTARFMFDRPHGYWWEAELFRSIWDGDYGLRAKMARTDQAVRPALEEADRLVTLEIQKRAGK